MDWHYGRGTMGKASGIHKGEVRQSGHSRREEMCPVTSSYLRLHKHWFTTKQLRWWMCVYEICLVSWLPSKGARSSNAPSDVHPEKTKLLIIRCSIGGHFRISTITCIWCTFSSFNILLQVVFFILVNQWTCFCVSRAVSHQWKTAKSC